MSDARPDLVATHLPPSERCSTGESTLLPALLSWLVATGRLTAQTTVAFEVPVCGRRVDVGLLSARGVTTAFELKIGSLQRAIQQGSYNVASFHRSWVVTGNEPRPTGVRWARETGVGVLYVHGDVVRVILVPSRNVPNPASIARTRRALRKKGEAYVDAAV